MTTPRTRARRSAVLLLATGATCLVGSALPLFAATADTEPGSGFGSFSLAANAPVLQARYDNPEQQCSSVTAGPGACEGVLNESVSTLSNGPIGHALASFGWPGTLGGNLGSLLIVASNGQVPEQATMLNDPIRAENFTNRKDETVTYNQIPGTLMTATATPTKVAATSVIGASQTESLGSIGQIKSSSSTTLTGEKSAEAVAHSVVEDITLGPLHIAAIVSDAKATTDGTKATTSGRTVVTGASIAGVPVTIDERGVSVQTQSVPFPSSATDAVNTALKQFGMSLAVSTPIGKPEGAKAVYNAGALNLVWNIPAPPASLPSIPGVPIPSKPGSASLVIGGAQVAVDATEGYDFGGGDTGGTTGGTTGGDLGGSTGGAVSVPPVIGGTTGFSPDTGTVPPPSTAGSAPLTATPVAARMPLPHGLSPWLGVLAVVGSVLVMAGLRRLPDHVLVTPASSCPQGDLA